MHFYEDDFERPSTMCLDIFLPPLHSLKVHETIFFILAMNILLQATKMTKQKLFFCSLHCVNLYVCLS